MKARRFTQPVPYRLLTVAWRPRCGETELLELGLGRRGTGGIPRNLHRDRSQLPLPYLAGSLAGTRHLEQGTLPGRSLEISFSGSLVLSAFSAALCIKEAAKIPGNPIGGFPESLARDLFA